MNRKIFHTPPLGDLTAPLNDFSVSKPSQPLAATGDTKPQRRRRAPSITEIPEAPAYRVQPLNHLTSKGGKWRNEAMRSHRTPTILWFTRGQGRVTVAGVTRGFGPHNFVFLPPRTMYGFEAVGQVYGHIVHIPDDPAFDLPATPLHMRFREVTQQNEISNLIESLNREIEGDFAGREKAMALQAGLIAVWLNRQTQVMPDYDLTPDAARRLAAAFTAQVETEFRTHHAVSHYAARLGVTPTHLSRACNIACGRPASAVLSDRVHFEARRMLRETDLPIQTVAEKLGFHSAAYFSRAFRRETGVSPRAFRSTK
ncbi:AraC family transcriptional regulator [Celeribacter arenosi]|uniref:Helix-turn-helix domain-containing protein n=1 Tax=Celeribacter arenosi TaxID=792649 RepID=A0ABP7KFQ0_9RHOB